MFSLKCLRVIQTDGVEIFKIYAVAGLPERDVELPVLTTQNVLEFSEKISEMSKAYRAQTGNPLRVEYNAICEPCSV